jgi:heme/copper-type cytochrome/quinol oxidase subunit 2
MSPPPSQPSGQPPNTGLWLGLSIATMIICCIPVGIPAVVFAAKAHGAASRGDYATAEQQVSKAKTWTIIAAVAGVIFAIVYGIFVFNTANTTTP